MKYVWGLAIGVAGVTFCLGALLGMQISQISSTLQPLPQIINQASSELLDFPPCAEKKFPTHVTKGKFFEDNSNEQFFVHCEVPQEVAVPSLYVVQKEGEELTVLWSKLLDFSSGLRSVQSPEVTDSNNDAVNEIYWGGMSWGGTCAPHADFGYLWTNGVEFSIQRSYDFDDDCYGSVLKETKLAASLDAIDEKLSTPFYDYLKSKVPPKLGSEGFTKRDEDAEHINYDGRAALNGRYGEFFYPFSYGKIICFLAEGSGAGLLPRNEQDSTVSQFCFSNQDEAKQMLGITDDPQVQDGGSCGTAKIVITDYVATKLKDGLDMALLVQVVSSNGPQAISSGNCPAL